MRTGTDGDGKNIAWTLEDEYKWTRRVRGHMKSKGMGEMGVPKVTLCPALSSSTI